METRPLEKRASADYIIELMRLGRAPRQTGIYSNEHLSSMQYLSTALSMMGWPNISARARITHIIG